MIPTWLGLLLALAALLSISQRSLYLAMFAAALILGLFTLPLVRLAGAFLELLRDPGIGLLTLVVGLIPLIGGGLEASGRMEELVRNMRLGRRASLAASSALLGMLPMPGGALLSAPLVGLAGGEVAGALKAAVNVWFRHILYLVYPLGPALIASAKVAGLEVYQAIPFLLPFFLLSILLGYLFLLRRVREGRPDYGRFSRRGLIIPLGIILAAPATDLILKNAFPLPVGELGTVVGVLLSLLLVALFGGLGLAELTQIGRKMRIWRFALIIPGMFFFLKVFQASPAPEVLSRLALPPAGLIVGGGFLLGLITGRISAPAAIIIPILTAEAGTGPLSLPVFALIFYSIFLGYLLTPVHPCISVSAEYFRVPLRLFLRELAPPAGLALAVTAALAMVLT
ncbi:TPA: DUF401 family protein [Candidatus Bipolaricaulota bacterium]|nr:DUF401 family protein [Candidatus Bipolaricaulota bacterium]